ncbi:UBA-like_superfamily [Hexamita inflata]|uniref:UBA-like superfamily n=1 Tax=Hexamita inflata TaxID=28002 RepID=A0AA86R296_9EUKA|nr:UBA-like superfamily [Hexamita inflata]
MTYFSNTYNSNTYNDIQKKAEKIKQFIEVTNSSQTQAIKFLNKYNQNVTVAINAFIESGEEPENAQVVVKPQPLENDIFVKPQPPEFAIKQMMEATSTSREQAIRFLQNNYNKVDLAIDKFIDSGEEPKGLPVKQAQQHVKEPYNQTNNYNNQNQQNVNYENSVEEEENITEEDDSQTNLQNNQQNEQQKYQNDSEPKNQHYQQNQHSSNQNQHKQVQNNQNHETNSQQQNYSVLKFVIQNANNAIQFLNQQNIQLQSTEPIQYNELQQLVQIRVHNTNVRQVYELMDQYIQNEYHYNNNQVVQNQLVSNNLTQLQKQQFQNQQQNQQAVQPHNQFQSSNQNYNQNYNPNVSQQANIYQNYGQTPQYQQSQVVAQNIPSQTNNVQPVQQYQQPQQLQAQSAPQQTAVQQPIYQPQMQQNSVQQVPSQQPLAAQQLYQQPQAILPQPQSIIHPVIPTYQPTINPVKQETTHNPPVFPVNAQIPAQQVQVQQKEPKNDQKQVQIEPKKPVKEENEEGSPSIVIDDSSISIDLDASS